MAENLGTATLDLEGDLTPLGKSIDQAKRDAQSGAQGIGQSFKSGIKKAVVPAVAALGAIALGVKKTTDAASDLGESQNAVAVVFGEASDKIINASRTAATEAGLSAAAYNQLVTPIGAALQNVGFSADAAADASINLASRAADMASVFNVDVSEALGAIQAGLRGEADPLERFGVGLSDAAVQAKALEMGMKKTDGELTAGQKTQARLALLFEQTDRVAGDFKNTSGELANQQRINAAESENQRAALGEGLLPVMEVYQGLLKTATAFMADHSGVVKVVAMVVAGLAIGVLAVNAALMLWSAGVAVATAAQWLWNAAMSANPIGLIVLALLALGVGLVVAYKKSETFRRIVQGALGAVVGAGRAVLGFFRSHWKTIALLISGPFLPIVALATDAFGIRSAIVGAVRGIMGRLRAWGGDVKSFLQGLPGRLASAALSVGSGIKAKLLDGLKGLGTGLLNAVRAAVNGVLSIIRGFRIPGFSVDPAGKFGPTISFGGFSPFAGIPALATGMLSFPGGAAVVGERGPELVNLPGGSDVFSAGRTRRMLGDGGFTLVNVMQLDGEEVYRNHQQVEARHMRRNGGG